MAEATSRQRVNSFGIEAITVCVIFRVQANHEMLLPNLKIHKLTACSVFYQSQVPIIVNLSAISFNNMLQNKVFTLAWDNFLTDSLNTGDWAVLYYQISIYLKKVICLCERLPCSPFLLLLF